jgi:hypothetical protein
MEKQLVTIEHLRSRKNIPLRLNLLEGRINSGHSLSLHRQFMEKKNWERWQDVTGLLD